ncbi:MAG TPA: anti-sigma factor [Actinomycetota bacterium]|nr:anti-sigma factor [Actinomycetota bacterium]
MSEHPYDELPGLLFGELNRAEVMEVSDHLAGCDDCRRELAVLAATSASLHATARQAQAVDSPERAVPDSATLPHRGAEPGTGSLEAALAPDGVTSDAGAPDAAAPDAVTPDAGRAGGRRRGPLVALAAALALALVTAAVLWTGGLLRPDRSASTVPLAGVGAVAASGQASMAGDDGQRQMTVTADDLPALRPGQYYEVWLLDPEAGAVFPVGVLPPDGEARFTLPASVVGRYRVIDVSLESDDGDPTHSKRSLLRGRYA